MGLLIEGEIVISDRIKDLEVLLEIKDGQWWDGGRREGKIKKKL